MDEVKIAHEYGDRITFMAGVDVQQLLPRNRGRSAGGSKGLINIYYKPTGGLLLSAGNGILGDTPLENIEAMLQEMALYRP